MADVMVGQLMAGRGITRAAAEAIADGSVMIAADAKRRSLIDDIDSFENTIANMRRVVARPAAGQPQSSVTPRLPELPPIPAVVRWNQAVDAAVQNGHSRLSAIRKVEKQFPGLREKMLAESFPEPVGGGDRR